MARIFAWLRPNDLIWNYWVNNYLLGNKPPAFDILFWNADTTRLPAAFHADLIGIFENNPYVNAGKMEVLGEPIDMQQVDVEAYIVAGITDHITPWRACYDTARIYGKRSEFVLANAGHLQSLLNPPGIAKSLLLRFQGRWPRPRRLGERGSAQRRQLVAALDGLDAAALGRAGAGTEEAGQPQAPARCGGAG